MLELVVSVIVATLIWGWMLVNCIRRQQITPLLGSENVARGFWLATFLFFNPVLLLLYVVFVRFRALALRRNLRDVLVIGSVATTLWLQFGARGSDPDEDWRDASGFALSLCLHGHQQESSNSAGSRNRGRPYAMEHVRIVHGEHPVLVSAARSFARALDEKRVVDRIECWPVSRRAERGARAPDFYVQLHFADFHELPLAGYQRFAGTVTMVAEARPMDIGATGSDLGPLRLARRDFDGELEFAFHRVGLAAGGSYYAEPAAPIVQWLVSSVLDPIVEMLREEEPLPELPGAFLFAEAELPAQLVGLELEPLDVEHARFVRNRSSWRLHDDRSVGDLYDALMPALEDDGWSLSGPLSDSGERTAMRMRRGPERLAIGRWPPIPFSRGRVSHISTVGGDGSRTEWREYPDLSPLTPFVVLYEQRFTREEIAAVRDAVCVEGADAATWLAFEALLVDEGKGGLREALRRDASPDAERWRMLAQLEFEVGERERAESALEVASALCSVTETSSATTQGVQRLAKRMGMSERLRKPVDGAVLTRAGMIELERDETASVELRNGEAVYVFRPAANDGTGPLVVAEIRVVGDATGPRLSHRISGDGGGVSAEYEPIRGEDGRFEFKGLSSFDGVRFEVVLEPTDGFRFRAEITGR